MIDKEETMEAGTTKAPLAEPGARLIFERMVEAGTHVELEFKPADPEHYPQSRTEDRWEVTVRESATGEQFASMLKLAERCNCEIKVATLGVVFS